MATVTSLYICISSICTYFYNFNYLSITYTLPIACQSLLVHILCLWHIFYLYFYCIPVSMLYISYTYHVHFLSYSYSVHVSYTFISRILSYNLSYTFLYFYLQSYTFHIRYFCMLSYDTFNVLYFPMFSIYYTFHIPFSCSYLFSCIILCTFYILYSCTVHFLYCFPVILFM